MLIPDKIFVSAKCYELALDSAGIFPQSVSGGEHAYEQRNQWQNGFNDAVLGISNMACRLMAYIEGLPEDQRTALAYLLANCGDLYVDPYEHRFQWSLCINDIFVPAAERRAIEPKDFPVLMDLHSRFKHDGFIAWVGHLDNCEPREKYRSENYKFGRQYLKDGIPIFV